uniref:NAD(P)H-quinone oxidoreductase subunit 6, chloroplastic n=1 Tax=Coleochaete scutata TaxID=3125 RepID=A0A191T5J3_COLSC|nr:subunit 6 of NADH-plastoquinone oxidoreductase [Coleochaete scutata]ANI25663.1 subunit 6 of NADH-plastoquinone oxidoreductase [Coleochaete scutata]
MNIINTTNFSFFIILSLLNIGILIGTLGVVFLANIVYSALFLGLTFISVALLYLLLDAEFLATTQVLIYVGAINVLILFAIMLVNKKTTQNLLKIYVDIDYISLLFSLSLMFFLILMINNTQWPIIIDNTNLPSDINRIGYQLLTDFVLPFELLSLLLLIALIGAVIIARREGETG